MAARSGMVTLIANLRSITETDVNDVTINGVAYWTDDQLQYHLDRNSKMVRDIPLVSKPLMNSGVTTYTEFYVPAFAGRNFETADTIGQFVLFDSHFTIINSALYTVDYTINQIIFTSDFGSDTVYLRARSFDLNASAQDVWLEKAAHRAALINWKAGGQTLAEDQEYQHCIEMANLYQGRMGLRSNRTNRVDYATWKN